MQSLRVSSRPDCRWKIAHLRKALVYRHIGICLCCFDDGPTPRTDRRAGICVVSAAPLSNHSLKLFTSNVVDWLQVASPPFWCLFGVGNQGANGFYGVSQNVVCSNIVAMIGPCEVFNRRFNVYRVSHLVCRFLQRRPHLELLRHKCRLRIRRRVPRPYSFR